jgi:hypothetical protein
MDDNFEIDFLDIDAARDFLIREMFMRMMKQRNIVKNRNKFTSYF